MLTLAVPTTPFLRALFDILEALPDVLSAWTIGLYQGAPTLSKDTILSNLTQPSWAGYAVATPGVPALQQAPNGDLLITWAAAVFQPSGAVSPTAVATGVFVSATISAADTLLLAMPLQTPKSFASALDALTVIVQTVVPNASVYGGLAAQV
jgi:hypothetical protein